MTGHRKLQMNHEDRRITEPEYIRVILDKNNVCTVAMQDEPYPYVVPMNYGYVWEEELVLYMHMADRGHRLDQLGRDPHVTCNVHLFLDRFGIVSVPVNHSRSDRAITNPAECGTHDAQPSSRSKRGLCFSQEAVHRLPVYE